MNPLEAWKKFESSFALSMTEVRKEALSEIWNSSASRTRFYEEFALPAVAKSLELKLKFEEFKIDYTLCQKSGSNVDVPLIYIESENVALSAEHEVRKLCCLNARLKILITCSEWTAQRPYWAHDGHRELLLERWSKIIRSFDACMPQEAAFGILVGERAGERLRFYSLLLDQCGDIQTERVLVDLSLT